jgi:uncharacterized OB-fold protein
MSTKPYTKPVPALDDPLMGPFWREAKQHRLTAQHCTNCNAWNFPALPICPACLEQALEWTEVMPRGTIWSYAVYHRAFHPGFEEDLPYVVGVIETPEGLRYIGRVIGPREKVKVGAAVNAVFADVTEEFTLLMWGLTDEDGTLALPQLDGVGDGR